MFTQAHIFFGVETLFRFSEGGYDDPEVNELTRHALLHGCNQVVRLIDSWQRYFFPMKYSTMRRPQNVSEIYSVDVVREEERELLKLRSILMRAMSDYDEQRLHKEISEFHKHGTKKPALVRNRWYRISDAMCIILDDDRLSGDIRIVQSWSPLVTAQLPTIANACYGTDELNVAMLNTSATPVKFMRGSALAPSFGRLDSLLLKAETDTNYWYEVTQTIYEGWNRDANPPATELSVPVTSLPTNSLLSSR